MPYAVQLYFDPVTDASVRRLWHRFADAGIARHLVESANRPHLTLAVYDDLDVAMAEQELQLFGPMLAPFPLTFGHVGFFGHPPAVVFLAPVVTSHLLELHRVTHERFGTTGSQPHPLYLPGRWVPHCSVAMHLPDQALAPALEVMQEGEFPTTGTVREVGIVQVSPTAHMVTVQLGAPG